MQRHTVNYKPTALFSPAVVAGRLVFTSGHVGFTQDRSEVPEGIEAQTAQTIENLKSTLAAAGASLQNVIKVNVYLTNIDDISAMSEVYRRYFPEDAPARTTVGVSGLARADLLVEIEMVAVLD